jgi:hypothetical protein
VVFAEDDVSFFGGYQCEGLFGLERLSVDDTSMAVAFANLSLSFVASQLVIWVYSKI